MVAARGRLRELGDEQHQVAEIVAGNGSGYAVSEARTDEFAAAAAELEACLARLDSLGVQVKDPDVGLLDFPAVRHGESVLLCWQLGEHAVEWWHDTDDGFGGRRPVDWDEE
jgi:hypothetical protein